MLPSIRDAGKRGAGQQPEQDADRGTAQVREGGDVAQARMLHVSQETLVEDPEAEHRPDGDPDPAIADDQSDGGVGEAEAVVGQDAGDAATRSQVTQRWLFNSS